ncbi:MAG: GPI anchored serine-threonine rich family protein [Solirubrobacterales bacterium]
MDLYRLARFPGSTHTFRWTYTGSPEPFRIDLINAQKVATTIAENVYAGASGVGSYDWAIPMNLAKGSYRMRLTYTDSGLVRTCETNGFPVSPVIFTTPTKTTTWQKGVPQTITWTAGGPPMNIRIYLLKSGTTIASITLNVPAAQGTLQYTPPSTLAAGTDYRVKATDDRGIGIIYSPYFAVN